MTTSTRRRVRISAVAVLAVGAAVVASPALPAQAAGSAGTAAAACPTTGGLPFTSKLTNGAIAIGKSATISGSTAKACGVLGELPDGTNGPRIPAKNIQFAPTVTRLGLLQLPTTLRATSALKGPAALVVKGTKATLTGSVVATAEVFGQKCDIPLTLTLTTGKSGALKGVPLLGDEKGVLHGRLVSNTFAVPAIQPSATCNPVVAALSNGLLGLPLPAGASTISYDASLAFDF